MKQNQSCVIGVHCASVVNDVHAGERHCGRAVGHVLMTRFVQSLYSGLTLLGVPQQLHRSLRHGPSRSSMQRHLLDVMQRSDSKSEAPDRFFR